MNDSNEHALIHKASPSVARVTLSRGKHRVLTAFLTHEIGEKLADIAARGGVSLRTLQRYMKDPNFRSELRHQVGDLLDSQRTSMAAALMRAAKTPGPGQAAAQSIYWKLLGELSTTKTEVSGPNGGAIRIEGQLDIALLSAPVKLLILAEVDGGADYMTGAERDALTAIAARVTDRVERREKPVETTGKLVKLIPKHATPDEVAL